MKAYVFLLLPLLLIGCCKAECTAPELVVSFQRLKATETDKLLLIRYNPAVGFSQPSDSVWKYTTVVPTDTTQSLVREWLDAYSNWKIVLPSINRQYRISSVEVKSFNC
jgi:hypothetical protein